VSTRGFRTLPLQAGPVDPTRLKNDNYEFIQEAAATSSDEPTLIFQDTLTKKGIIMYEVRLVGKGEANFMALKRTFTVFKGEGVPPEVLDISSDYTKKTNAAWGYELIAETNDIIIKVKGSADETIQWSIQIIKTIHLV